MFSLPVSAQRQGNFFIGGLAETAFYSDSSIAWGGGLTAGYGVVLGGAVLGIRTVCFTDPGGLVTLELCAFLRFYRPDVRSRSGFYLQFNAGPSFFDRGRFPLPAQVGILSAGAQAGWRFIIKDRYYLEPAIRAGYPYIAGAGLSAGYSF